MKSFLEHSQWFRSYVDNGSLESRSSKLPAHFPLRGLLGQLGNHKTTFNTIALIQQ